MIKQRFASFFFNSFSSTGWMKCAQHAIYWLAKILKFQRNSDICRFIAITRLQIILISLEIRFITYCLLLSLFAVGYFLYHNVDLLCFGISESFKADKASHHCHGSPNYYVHYLLNVDLNGLGLELDHSPFHQKFLYRRKYRLRNWKITNCGSMYINQ